MFLSLIHKRQLLVFVCKQEKYNANVHCGGNSHYSLVYNSFKK